MSVLTDWINDYYLEARTIARIKQDVLVRPSVKYIVLDDFFKSQKLEQLIAAHHDLPFSEEVDRRGHDGSLLPYDGAVVFARPGLHYGSDLFFADAWHRYLADLVHCQLDFPTTTEVKLRWHRPEATGFWVHTDGTIRKLVAICYFNKDWLVSDGGLLQLWRVDESRAPGTPFLDRPDPHSRLDCLTKHQRIRIAAPGGGFSDRCQHDLVLLDQVVPAYNRLFICNFQADPAYHSVTPSNGRERLGVVQWLGVGH